MLATLLLGSAATLAAWGRRGLRSELETEEAFGLDGAVPKNAPNHRWRCGLIEEGVDLWTRQQVLYTIPNVPSATVCQDHCFREGRCMAWTWGRERGVPGLSDVCFVKELEQMEHPVAKVNPAVVSGSLPCDMDRIASPGTLFCFALIQPSGYEVGLLSMQYGERASLFSCEAYTVYSNKAMQIAPGVQTSVVDSDLKCDSGGEFGTVLNLGIFLIVWNKVIEDGVFKDHDWTVKVDADTVFFPDRLRKLLPHHHMHEKPSGTYLSNCKFGMHGPLEVFSKNAVLAWVSGSDTCIQHFNKLCSGDCMWGEDMFIDQCLSRVLNASRENDWGLLSEDHCEPDPKRAGEWEACTDGRVAFHPFKTAERYRACMVNATEGPTATLPPPADGPRAQTKTAASPPDTMPSGEGSSPSPPGRCPAMENNTDFDAHREASAWAESLGRVPFPEMCCALCRGVARCEAWVWREDPARAGRHRCWLLPRAPAETDRVRRVGVVSGLPPPGPGPRPERNASEDKHFRGSEHFVQHAADG